MQRFLLLVISCIVMACGQVRPPDAFNFYGGVSRSSNYENATSFTDAMFISDFPKKNDSLAPSAEMLKVGANMPPIPISYLVSYLTLLDGSAVRYAGGRIEWKAPFDEVSKGKKAIAAALSCTDKEDNFYVFANDGAVYCFDKTGKRRWKNVLFTPTPTALFSDVLIQPDGIIAGFSADGTRGALVKCTLDGSIAWKQEFGLAPTRTFAADESGNLIVALSANTAGASDSLLSLTPNGARRWAKGITNTRLLRMPMIGAGMVLIAGIRENAGQREDVLLAFDENGSQRWAKPLTFTPQGMAIGSREGSPLLVVAGYRTGMGEALSLVLGLNAEGKEQWRLSYDVAVLGAPMVSQENIVFIATKGEAVGAYFMSKEGVFQRVVSLSNVALCLIPSVDSENNIVFATTEELGVVKIGKVPAQRILPY